MVLGVAIRSLHKASMRPAVICWCLHGQSSCMLNGCKQSQVQKAAAEPPVAVQWHLLISISLRGRVRAPKYRGLQRLWGQGLLSKALVHVSRARQGVQQAVLILGQQVVEGQNQMLGHHLAQGPQVVLARQRLRPGQHAHRRRATLSWRGI